MVLVNIAVVEDNINDIDNLTKNLDSYKKNSTVLFNIDTFFCGEDFLIDYKYGKYDAVFLDIYMKGITGVDVAKKIREVDKEVKIIFTSTSKEHYADGFDVSATHYLIKPLNYEKFLEALMRIIPSVQENNKPVIVLNDKGKEIKLLQNKILYIETQGNFCIINFANGSLKVRIPLKNISQQLDETIFCKCHKCYIVNLNFVKEIQGDFFILTNQSKIDIRRHGRQEVKNKYYDFYVNKLRKVDFYNV